MNELTVVIPTYNSAKYIRETLNCLLSQSFKNWNCIIADDFSSDETVTIIEEYLARDKRLYLIKNANRKGAVENWNFLLSKVQTEYVKVLHADDLLHVTHIDICMKLLKEDSDVVLISTNRSFARKPKVKTSAYTRVAYKKFNKKMLLNRLKFSENNFIHEPSFAIFKTEILKKVGGFNKSWNYLVDLDAYLRVLQYGSYIKVNNNLGSFRVSDSSWSKNLAKVQYKELRQFFNQIFEEQPSTLGMIQSYIRYLLRNLYYFVSRLVLER